MKKSVLLVGGTGLLSSAVTSELLKQNFSVSMINRGNSKIPENVCFIQSDCNNYSYIKEKLQKKNFDAIIDFLCYSENQLVNSFKLYSNFTTQYFFISSCAVYIKEKNKVCKEDSPKGRKEWKYSIDKLNCEITLEKLSKNTNCKYTIIRPCITYGDSRIPYGIAPKYGYHWTLVARILANKPIITWNNGINRVNMLHVNDFAVGLAGLIGNQKAMNESFNICSDETPTFKEVLTIISNYLNRELITIDITPEFYAKNYPSRKEEILAGRASDSLNSNEKIKTVVPDFKQTISINDGVIKTIQAYEDQNYQKGIDWIFDACTDRIIKKWCKKNKIKNKSYNLGFVDYLGNATKKDYHLYKKELNSDKIYNKIFNFVKKSLKKILGKVKY